MKKNEKKAVEKTPRKRRVEISLHTEGRKFSIRLARNSKRNPAVITKRLTGRDVRGLIKALAGRL